MLMKSTNMVQLMKERNINKAELARESGVPYTTIDGFYKKGWENVKLSTLLKLAAYFEVSVDYLVSGTEGGAKVVVKEVVKEVSSPAETYTEKEKKVIAAYREGGEKRELIDRVVKGEKLVAEAPKPAEPAPVRRKRKDDIIIF